MFLRNIGIFQSMTSHPKRRQCYSHPVQTVLSISTLRGIFCSCQVLQQQANPFHLHLQKCRVFPPDSTHDPHPQSHHQHIHSDPRISAVGSGGWRSKAPVTQQGAVSSVSEFNGKLLHLILAYCLLFFSTDFTYEPPYCSWYSVKAMVWADAEPQFDSRQRHEIQQGVDYTTVGHPNLDYPNHSR